MVRSVLNRSQDGLTLAVILVVDQRAMHSRIHSRAVELLLDAMSKQSDDWAVRASFLFGRPNALAWQGFTVDIYYDTAKLVQAALHVREHGPAYLRHLSIEVISGKLQGFIRDNYGYVFNEVSFAGLTGSFASRLGEATKMQLAEALASSDVFRPRDELTLFPIVPLRVTSPFDGRLFFFVGSSTDELQHKLPAAIARANVAGDQFPPILGIVDSKKRQQPFGAWLGIRSPAFQASNKMNSAILGAIALTPVSRVRHLFSDRDMFGGRCTATEAGTTTVSFGESHTPALMSDIVLDERDADWLNILAAKLTSGEAADRRQMRALEYFYRAWPLDPSERFPVLCMSLDAVFGDASHATASVIDGIRSLVGAHVQEARLRHLLELRASVIHGGAPDVYDSRKYARYYRAYGDDPIRDLELLVGQCLRLRVFDGALTEHADPNADQIAQMRESGRLPKNRRTILDV